MISRQSTFRSRAAEALQDQSLRSNVRIATTKFSAARESVFPDAAEFDVLRSTAHAIRARSLALLPELLERLEKRCRENGIEVHWAETPAEANGIVLDILRQRQAKRVVKGKSMVSEEIGLNDFLEQHGIEATETDLGEFIVQLAHERPSHIIVPAIHKNRHQIGRLFQEKLPGVGYTDVPEELTAIARTILRQKFLDADAGISGVNFAVAETGTICLVENEGNGRMCTTVPPVHIAIMGIERVVEKLEDVPVLLDLLTRSCTGQIMSTYFNMISSPRRPGEKDGPNEVHLILLDNGRSRIYQDAELRQILLCIRCSACLNHCPVYTRVGGHVYGQIYVGPMGIALAPQIEGLQNAGDVTAACTLCGACSSVCPVKVPISDIVLRLRYEAVNSAPDSPVLGHGTEKSAGKRIGWRLWQTVVTSSALYRAALKTAGLAAALIPVNWMPFVKEWARTRTIPRFAKKSLHERIRQEEPHE